MQQSGTRGWMYGAALAALALAMSPAVAGTIERIDTPSVAAPSAYPGSAPAEMRSWVQLVWDPVARQLTRQSYTAWDPIPALGLELQWRPDDPAAAPGLLTGKGTLLFRRKGAPSYDATAVVARYRGDLVDGRADGEGAWLDFSGYAYSGQWRDGLMAGEGRLSLPNGDEYVGMFDAGRRNGPGVYIDSTGAIYDGRFTDDLRDGAGIFIPASGDPYTADWVRDGEVLGSRMAVPETALRFPRLVRAQYQDVPNLRVGLVAERRPHNFELDLEPMSYTSKSDGVRLDIFPDDQRLLDLWHGAIPIGLTEDEIIRFSSVSEGFTPSFLGYYERYEPLSLVFDLENVSTETVAVVGGFLDVAKSIRQPEPAVQLRADRFNECGDTTFYRPYFFLDNFGWGAAANARLDLQFGATDGRLHDRALTRPLGTLEESVGVDFTSELEAIGVDTARAASEMFMCTDRSDARLCLGEIRQSGYYGSLAPFVTLNDSAIEAKVSGTLEYDWTAADGTVAHKSSPFSSVLQLGHLFTQAECGEGGEIIPVNHDPFTFKLDQSGYKIAIPFSGDVAPGFTTRWRIELKAPETSEHDFVLVLVLADGRQVASRPAHLTYFNPPVRAISDELLGF